MFLDFEKKRRKRKKNSRRLTVSEALNHSHNYRKSVGLGLPVSHRHQTSLLRNADVWCSHSQETMQLCVINSLQIH